MKTPSNRDSIVEPKVEHCVRDGIRSCMQALLSINITSNHEIPQAQKKNISKHPNRKKNGGYDSLRRCIKGSEQPVRGWSFQKKNVNVAAMNERATPACAARMDTAPTTSPPAELLLLAPVVVAAEPDEAPEDDPVGVEDVVLSPVLEVEERAVEDRLVVVFVGVVLLPEPERYDGAGTAVLGLVSAPVPQGIASPSGWVAFVGGVVAPVESAMANRPVHVWFGDAGEENW